MDTNGKTAVLPGPRKPKRSLESLRKGEVKVRPAPRPGESGRALHEWVQANELLTRELEEANREKNDLLKVLMSVESGDFTVRATPGRFTREVARSLNSVIAMNERMASEFERVSRVVGKKAIEPFILFASAGMPYVAISVQAREQLLGLLRTSGKQADVPKGA